MTIRSLFSLMLPLFVLFGCATVPESQTSVEWQAHEYRLTELSQYQATGKFGYIGAEQRQNFNFFWSQSPTKSELRLSTFLGQTALKLVITPEKATIETYDDQILSARSANQLVTQLTGLMLPVESMQDWLIGLPTDADRFELSENNTLQTIFKQVDGTDWQVAYANYSDVTVKGLALPLPSRLKLTTHDTKINLVISKWNKVQ